MKFVLRIVLASFMIFAGILHFANPPSFTRIVPDYLPWPTALVLVSGFFEILGGVGILIPRFRHPAAIGLIALYICVFPANLNMAINHISFGTTPTPDWVLWTRCAFQFVLIYWAWWMRT